MTTAKVKAVEGTAVQAKARQSLKMLTAALRAAAKHPGKEKSIHDLRVSIRRFKQALRVFAAHFDRARKMRRSLRGLMDLCAAARNCDVAVEVLEAAGVPAAGALKTALAKYRAKATKELARELKDWDIQAHTRRWRDWLTVKAEATSDSTPPAAIPELSGDFLKTGASAASADAAYRQMHRFRLLVKKTRYASEILDAPEAQIERLRGLQDRLGAINDCVTTGDLIADMKLDTAERRKIKAAVNKLTAQRAGEFRTYWKTHFGRKGASAQPRKAS